MLILAGIGSVLAAPVDVQPVDTVLVPGCPCNEDGTLSTCQWQRAIWAAHLWERGETRSFITSGNAVYNRYIEAEAVRQGMIALGVPEQVIYTETQALHSDENAGYGLEVVRELGFETVGVASVSGQTGGLRSMLREWDQPTVGFRMKMPLVKARMRQALPEVTVEPVPADEWLPLRQRERLIADRLGARPRPNSFVVYTVQAIKGAFGNARQPTPPVHEPTLTGLRHRVDTLPWGGVSDDVTEPGS